MPALLVPAFIVIFLSTLYSDQQMSFVGVASPCWDAQGSGTITTCSTRGNHSFQISQYWVVNEDTALLASLHPAGEMIKWGSGHMQRMCRVWLPGSLEESYAGQ
ncbi:hypothetical protein C8J57DRAFT_1244573 [Mycena rebaudengoi]|nr:hypothetical protein C8J57DRAFT_1244573 [Mycena rebaudengoi]